MVAAQSTPVPRPPSETAPSETAPSEDAPTTVRATSSRPPPPATNRTLGPGSTLNEVYRLSDRLGEGGVGSVYRATDLRSERTVAIKLLQQMNMGEMDMRPRFEREAKALGAMRHPNIVRFQDYGVHDGRPYLVMDLVEGVTLLDRIKRDGALGTRRAISITRQILYALAYAHDRGMVHRDLKSANVMVQSLPHQPEHVTLLDFGFVKLLPGSHVDGTEALTQVGTAFGSPPYISPEQATGSEVDARADLYSVGVLLFEMLTGTRPFDGSVTEVLRHHLASPVPLLSSRTPELAARHDLQRLIERAMAKSRHDRFPTADAFLVALDSVDNHALSVTELGDSARVMVARGWRYGWPWLLSTLRRVSEIIGPWCVRGLQWSATYAKQAASRVAGWVAKGRNSDPK